MGTRRQEAIVWHKIGGNRDNTDGHCSVTENDWGSNFWTDRLTCFWKLLRCTTHVFWCCLRLGYNCSKILGWLDDNDQSSCICCNMFPTCCNDFKQPLYSRKIIPKMFDQLYIAFTSWPSTFRNWCNIPKMVDQCWSKHIKKATLCGILTDWCNKYQLDTTGSTGTSHASELLDVARHRRPFWRICESRPIQGPRRPSPSDIWRSTMIYGNMMMKYDEIYSIWVINMSQWKIQHLGNL